MSVTFFANSIQKIGFDAAAEPTITGEAFVCSGGETTDPAYDLLDNRRTNVVTYDSNAETTTIANRIDCTSSMACTYIIVDNHNLKTAGAIIDISQGGSDITITSSYSGILGNETAADSIGSGDSTIVADGITLLKFSLVADTRWDITFDDVAAGYDADITVGEISAGAEFAPARNPELQPKFGYEMPGSSFRESEGGQRYGFSTHTNKKRRWSLMWKFMSDADKSNLEDIFLFTRGVKYPFYIDLGPILGATNPQLFYVRFMRGLNFIGLTADAWQVTVDIEEEI